VFVADGGLLLGPVSATEAEGSPSDGELRMLS